MYENPEIIDLPQESDIAWDKHSCMLHDHYPSLKSIAKPTHKQTGIISVRELAYLTFGTEVAK